MARAPSGAVARPGTDGVWRDSRVKPSPQPPHPCEGEGRRTACSPSPVPGRGGWGVRARSAASGNDRAFSSNAFSPRSRLLLLHERGVARITELPRPTLDVLLLGR